MGLISRIRLWDTTKEDNKVDKIVVISIAILTIIGFPIIGTNIKPLIIIWFSIIILFMISSVAWGFRNAGNRKYIDETDEEFKSRTGLDYNEIKKRDKEFLDRIFRLGIQQRRGR